MQGGEARLMAVASNTLILFTMMARRIYMLIVYLGNLSCLHLLMKILTLRYIMLENMLLD